jgi:hypothetical protein
MTMTANNDSETTRIEMSSPTSVAIVAPRASKVEPFDLSKQESQDQEQCCWSTLKPSAKSLRTHNPIRAIVDPIAATIQSGEARGDGKDLISLAVRLFCSVLFARSVGPIALSRLIGSRSNLLHSLFLCTLL